MLTGRKFLNMLMQELIELFLLTLARLRLSGDRDIDTFKYEHTIIMSNVHDCVQAADEEGGSNTSPNPLSRHFERKYTHHP